MTSVLRTDRRSAITALARPTVTFEGVVARTHDERDPLVYPEGNEYRRADQLAGIAEQLAGKPVTALHPDDMAAGSPQVVGRIDSARVDGDLVIASFTVDGLEVADEIRKNLRELSLGYFSRLDGARYQTDIRVDHLALVPLARCGAECGIRVDAADVGSASFSDGGGAASGVASMLSAGRGNTGIGVQSTAKSKNCTCGTDGNPLADHVTKSCDCTAKRAMSADGSACTCNNRTIGYLPEEHMDINELQTKLTAALLDAAQLRTRADAADARATSLEVDRDNARAELVTEKAGREAAIGAEKARADAAITEAQASAEKIRQDAATAQSAAVNSRVALLTAAAGVLGEVDQTKSDRDIKCAVIKHVDGRDVPAEKPDLYVDGIYDGALDRHVKASGSRADALVAMTGMRASKDSATVVTAGSDKNDLDGEDAATRAMNYRFSGGVSTDEDDTASRN